MIAVVIWIRVMKLNLRNAFHNKILWGVNVFSKHEMVKIRSRFVCRCYGRQSFHSLLFPSNILEKIAVIQIWMDRHCWISVSSFVTRCHHLWRAFWDQGKKCPVEGTFFPPEIWTLRSHVIRSGVPAPCSLRAGSVPGAELPHALSGPPSMCSHISSSVRAICSQWALAERRAESFNYKWCRANRNNWENKIYLYDMLT